MEQSNKRFLYAAAAVAILAPILNYYGYGFLSLAFVAVSLLFVCWFCRKGVIKFMYTPPMLWFIAYYCFMWAINSSSVSGMIAPSIIFIFLLWGFMNMELKISIFLKTYRIVTFVSIALFIIQELSYFTTGVRIPGLLTFLPLTISDNVSDWSESVSTSERSAGLFSEPAHFVQFLLPITCAELFYVKNKKAYIRSAVYIAVLLLLRSGNALIGICVITLFFIASIMRRMQLIPALLISCFCIGAIAVPAGYYFQTENGMKLLERTEELDPDTDKVSSGFKRAIRGYYVWEAMSPVEKIVGLNSTEKLENTIKRSSVNWVFDDNDRYLNAFQTVLIQNGLIGVALFLSIIISIWRANNLAGRCCLTAYVALSFIASIFFSYTMLLYFLFAMLMHKEQLSKKQYCWGKLVIFTLHTRKNEKSVVDNYSLN